LWIALLSTTWAATLAAKPLLEYSRLAGHKYEKLCHVLLFVSDWVENKHAAGIHYAGLVSSDESATAW
jgi:hypothetical protein